MKLNNSKSIAFLTLLTLVLSACGEATPAVDQSAAVPEEPKYPVTVTQVHTQVQTTLEATGTVESKRSTQVFAPTAGVVAQLFVRDGARVSRGTPLYKIGGSNGTPHALEIQMKSAYAQAVAAVNSYNTTIRSNQLALDGAYLGYYGAVNQTQASLIDQSVFDTNRSGYQQSLALLNDNLQLTRTKNEQDRQKIVNDASLSAAQKQAALDGLEIGLRSAENQIIAQINQTQTQSQVLDLNQQSVSYKLGLTDTGSFTEAQSWLQIPTTQIRNEASVSQARTQAELAKNQYELAKSQYEGLLVRAQSSGVVSNFDLSLGSPVNPQVSSMTIVDGSSLTADVGVSEADAYLINNKTKVEIQVGAQFVGTKIVSISPQVDLQSKKVMITLAIPANTVRVNGTVTARFYLDANVSKKPHVYVPLDAVIVSTEETFVFVIQDGKAKKRSVTRGEIAHDQVEILDGLSNGDVIILSGAKEIFDDQAVEVTKQL